MLSIVEKFIVCWIYHVTCYQTIYSVADLNQNLWGSQNNILKIYIFNITATNSIK